MQKINDSHKNTGIGKRISNTVWIIMFSLLSMNSYANTELSQALDAKDTIESDEFCVADTFNGVIDWLAERLEYLDNKYLNGSDDDDSSELAEQLGSEHDLVEEDVQPSKPLDLTIPEVEHTGTMELVNGMETQLPDMFSEQTKKAYSKEEPSASFGGRLLMDDDQLEEMEEYRLKNVRDAVRGAEVSLEFKTN